jgi:hypothetical protein
MINKQTLLTCAITLLVQLLYAESAMAQQEGNGTIEIIQAKAVVVDETTIKLRWAPSTPHAWIDGNKYGYTVERHTVFVDEQWKQLGQNPVLEKVFKALPIEEWEEHAILSDYAAVIAQALYGEKFELSANQGEVANIINQATELEQRFSTSVFMAEYDFKAAEMAGWGWTDTSVRANEKYLYRVYINRLHPQVGDTAVVFLGYDDKLDLPKPIGLNAIFGDQSMMLSWNYVYLSDIYHSYHIERMSETDPVFRQITDLPVTALDMEARELFFGDSLPVNDLEFTYRIRGLTSFGEWGPFSDSISGKGNKTVNCLPQIKDAYFSTNNNVVVHWEFDCEEIELIDKLQLYRSEDIEEGYELIQDDISKSLNEYTVELISDKNYIKIAALTSDSLLLASFPYLVNRIDSIPPQIPTGLTVVIDSMCIAHLTWDMNTETDLRGYRILRSFTEKEEASSITSAIIPMNEYIDTLSASLGNAYVFYSVTALDLRYNESQPCEKVKVAKPTNATPNEPVIVRFETEDNKINLSWLTETKRTDITYFLIRTSVPGGEKDTLLVTNDPKVNIYKDEVESSGTYSYQLVAKDLWGKESSSPQAVEVELTVFPGQEIISRFNSYTDVTNNYIELSWKKPDNARLYRIYKSSADIPMSLWKELDAAQNRIVDEQVSPGNEYRYTIIYQTQDGYMSKSKSIVIHF